MALIRNRVAGYLGRLIWLAALVPVGNEQHFQIYELAAIAGRTTFHLFLVSHRLSCTAVLFSVAVDSFPSVSPPVTAQGHKD